MDTVTDILDVLVETAAEIRDGLADRRHPTDGRNPSGDDQLRADVWADNLLASRLTELGGVGAYASEERDTIVDAGAGLSVAVDPLDGSHNLRSNNVLGSIVGIYDEPLPASGRSMVAAGYVLYGPITSVVFSDGEAVTEYVVEGGRRDVLEEAIEIPDTPEVYGFGGHSAEWTPEFREFARDRAGDLSTRYGGAMVGDINQILAFGGIYAYPSLASRPEGKLRLQFEALPAAYIVEAAGGRSSDGTASILETAPTDLHQRTPVYLGNDTLVGDVESRVRE